MGFTRVGIAATERRLHQDRGGLGKDFGDLSRGSLAALLPRHDAFAVFLKKFNAVGGDGFGDADDGFHSTFCRLS